MTADKWVWMPHPAHFICSDKCQFHLATYVGGYIVSTVGEWWPERDSREIHAEVYDAAWLTKHRHLKGDHFDNAYAKRFGFMEIGVGRKYETMVFKARTSDSPDRCQACPWFIDTAQDVDSDGYNDSKEAFEGHLALCQKWSKPEAAYGRIHVSSVFDQGPEQAA